MQQRAIKGDSTRSLRTDRQLRCNTRRPYRADRAVTAGATRVARKLLTVRATSTPTLTIRIISR
jgi:hypothetical protein